MMAELPNTKERQKRGKTVSAKAVHSMRAGGGGGGEGGSHTSNSAYIRNNGPFDPVHSVLRYPAKSEEPRPVQHTVSIQSNTAFIKMAGIPSHHVSKVRFTVQGPFDGLQCKDSTNDCGVMIRYVRGQDG